MLRSMRLLALVALACTVLLAGCGGASEEDQVKQAFDDYVQAVKDGDEDRFCDSIVSSELLEMSDGERAKETQLCKDEFSGDGEEFDETSGLLDTSEVGEVTVNGDRATAAMTVTVKGKKTTSKTRFVKVGGDWKVLFESR